MNEEITRSLEEAVTLFAAYEKAIWRDNYRKVTKSIIDLQDALEQMPNPMPSLIHAAVQGVLAPNNQHAGYSITESFERMNNLHAAKDQADEVRCLLAVYADHAESKAELWLRKRKEICAELRKLVAILQKISE